MQIKFSLSIEYIVCMCAQFSTRPMEIEYEWADVIHVSVRMNECSKWLLLHDFCVRIVFFFSLFAIFLSLFSIPFLFTLFLSHSPLPPSLFFSLVLSIHIITLIPYGNNFARIQIRTATFLYYFIFGETNVSYTIPVIRREAHNFTHSCESKWAKLNGLSSTQFLLCTKIVLNTESVEHAMYEWTTTRKPIEHNLLIRNQITHLP